MHDSLLKINQQSNGAPSPWAVHLSNIMHVRYAYEESHPMISLYLSTHLNIFYSYYRKNTGGSNSRCILSIACMIIERNLLCAIVVVGVCACLTGLHMIYDTGGIILRGITPVV